MWGYATAFVAGWSAHAILAESRSGDSRDGVEKFLAERETTLREQYATTDMDYVEFGDRIATVENPGTERIMRDAVRVDGIGVETAWEIARTFGGEYDAYAAADREELERVNGVGENRATALLSN